MTSPRKGRPTKGETKRDKRLEMRLTAEEYNTIQETADAHKKSKTDLIVTAVNFFKSKK